MDPYITMIKKVIIPVSYGQQCNVFSQTVIGNPYTKRYTNKSDSLFTFGQLSQRTVLGTQSRDAAVIHPNFKTAFHCQRSVKLVCYSKRESCQSFSLNCDILCVSQLLGLTCQLPPTQLIKDRRHSNIATNLMYYLYTKFYFGNLIGTCCIFYDVLHIHFF